MTVYNSSFQDADYGCGSPSQISGQFTLEPTGFTRSTDDPSVALVTFSYTNQLTLQNIKYNTTSTQDISAWLVYTTSEQSLGSTDKTFVSRQDCTTTTNSLSSTVPIPITSDTFVKFGARWSGFEINPDGLAMDGLEWFNFDLTDDYTITPPQNLQVTFPSTPDGQINASIASWSKNSNIGGAIQADGVDWNWRVELLSKTGDVLTTKTFNDTSLTPTLTADISKVKTNEQYQLKVTACNSFQAMTAVSSPMINSLPPKPIIQRVRFEKQTDGTYTAMIDWAKPTSGGGYTEFVRLNVAGYATDQLLGTIENGASGTGSINVPGLPAATEITIKISNTSAAGSVEASETVTTPSEVPELSAAWDSTHRCVTVSASAANITNYDFELGYFQGDDSLGTASGTSIEACDLKHGNGEVLYASATPKTSKTTFTDKTGYATFPILNPILGVSNDCDDKLNVVDIVEMKDGALTDRWQTGERVRIEDPCPLPWGSITYLDDEGKEQVYELQSLTDFNHLGNSGNASTALTFLGLSIPKSRIIGVSVGGNITSIPAWFCSQCNSLQRLKLGRSVISIGTNFLDRCSSFNSPIQIPRGVTSINFRFLSGCSSFNQPILIPNSVTSIGDYFLSNSTNFDSPLHIPNSVTIIRSNFLSGCTAFNQPITLPDSLAVLSTSFMSGCSSFNQPLVLPNTIQTIGNEVLRGLVGFNSPLTLPDSLTRIGNWFLSSCTAFNQPLILPTSLVEIGAAFLHNATNFNQQIVIPPTLTTIGPNFMDSWTNFTQPLTVPATVQSIGDYFMNTPSNFIGPLTVHAAPPSGDSSFVAGTSSTPAYTHGIDITGSTAEDWVKALPNRTSPYRKLNLISS